MGNGSGSSALVWRGEGVEMTRSARRTVTLMLGIVAMFVFIGCSSDSGDGASSSAAASGSSPSACGEIMPAADDGIEVTEMDFSIEPASTSADAGPITFDIQNEGPQTHEFVVFKTDLDPADLPTNDDGTVDEEGKGVKHIDEIEDIAPCTAQSLSVDLDAGNYVFICNLPGHYASGMHTSFTVS